MTAFLIAGCPRGDSGSDLNFNVGGPPTPIDVDGDPVFQSGVIFDALLGRTGSHAPAITALPDGELLAAWYSYAGPSELDDAVIYVSRRLSDPDRRMGGPPLQRWGTRMYTQEGWTAPAKLVDRGESVGNPVLYSEAEQVWLFYAVVPGGWGTAWVEVQQSADGGQTWSSPRRLPGPLGTNVRSPPVRLGDGTLLLPAYSDLLLRSLFFACADGEAWTLRSELTTRAPHFNLQPSLAALGDGRLLAAMRNSGRGWLWAAESQDSGWTWTAPTNAGFRNPDSPAALLRSASGNLILIFNDSDTLRRPLSVAISADEGVTWHPPRVLADGDGEYAYPAAVQTPDGLIHVVYSHNRERIGHLTFNEAWLAGVGRAR